MLRLAVWMAYVHRVWCASPSASRNQDKQVKFVKAFNILPKFWRQKQNNISLISFELESDQFFIYQKNIFDGANFSFLNKEIEFNDKIWTSRSDSILWDYNLNYFDLLNYDQRVDERTKYLLVRSWLRNVNHFQGIAYHPYPISLRVVNLIKWLATENISDDEIRKSLIHQVRFLNLRLEKHLLANPKTH